MAEAKTTTFGKLLIKLGDGADPEVFAQPCGMTSKSLTFSKNTGETLVVDCDDEDQVTWLERNAESLSASVSGDGVLAASSIQPWWGRFREYRCDQLRAIDPVFDRHHEVDRPLPCHQLRNQRREERRSEGEIGNPDGQCRCH